MELRDITDSDKSNEEIHQHVKTKEEVESEVELDKAVWITTTDSEIHTGYNPDWLMYL